MYPKNKTFQAVLCCLLTAVLSAQTDPVRLPAADVSLLQAEDERTETARYSAPLKLDLAPAPETYAYAEGEWSWTQTFTMTGATGLGLFVDELALPEGGRLLLTNEHGVQGPFTQADAGVKGRLFTDFLPGESVRLTYRGPLPETTPFHVWRVDHVYRPDRWKSPLDKGFEDSNECQVNAGCTDGQGWEDERSGTGRINIVVAEGVGFCSGNLVNNTARDGRPFLLTGFHCMDGFTPLYDLWSVDFDYAGADCDDPAVEPVPTRYVGVEFRAGWQATDFMLLEILDDDFVTEDHYFAGWDRSAGDVAAPVIHFHHPFGDVQKLGVSDGDGAPILTNHINWNSGVVTPPSHHFVMDYAVGDYMIGSSGSCYFDADHRIIGTLNGGKSRCPGISEAFIGRFHLSWDTGTADSTNLRFWLDPLGGNPTTLDGETLMTKLFVRGTVTHEGRPVEGATIRLLWADGGQADFVSDANGRYAGERPNGVMVFGVVGRFGEGQPLTNGVDVGDIITVRRHILTLDTLPPERRLAVDINSSGTVRVSDITRITRGILGVGDWADRPNWLVLPVGFPLDPVPTDPAAPVGIQLNRAGQRNLDVAFFVVKTGDANGDAAE